MNKSLQLPLTIAFVVALSIVCLHHLGELIGWFTLAFVGFGGTQWALSQPQAVDPEQAADFEQPEPEIVNEVRYPEQVFSLLETTEEVTTGTDLWVEVPQPDAVETIEPTPTPKEKGIGEIQFELLVQQLETLPQKKGRRKAWAVLCNRLHIKGGTKVRDANLVNKAKFLESQNVKIPELIKAKVIALRAA